MAEKIAGMIRHAGGINYAHVLPSPPLKSSRVAEETVTCEKAAEHSCDIVAETPPACDAVGHSIQVDIAVWFGIRFLLCLHNGCCVL